MTDKGKDASLEGSARRPKRLGDEGTEVATSRISFTVLSSPDDSKMVVVVEGGREIDASGRVDESRASGGPAALLDWAKNNLPATLTIIGFLLFGSLRIAYSLFYTPLGTTPEEVGLGYAEVISQSVAGLLTFLILFFLVACSLTAPVGLLLIALGAWSRRQDDGGPDEPSTERRPDGPRPGRFRTSSFWAKVPRPLKFLALLLVIIAAVIAVFTELFVPAAMTVFWLWILKQSVGEARRQPQLLSQLFHFFAKLTVAAAILTMVAILLAAHGDALDVKKGYARRADFAGLRALPYGADAVTVSWTNGSPPVGPDLSRCLMYLGAADGTAILFRVASQQTIRIPLGQIVVRHEPTLGTRDRPCK